MALFVSDFREAAKDPSMKKAGVWPREMDPSNDPKEAKFFPDLMDLCPRDSPRRMCTFLERCSMRQFEVVWVSVLTNYAMDGGLRVESAGGLAMLLATVRNVYMKKRGRPTRWGVTSPCAPIKIGKDKR